MRASTDERRNETITPATNNDIPRHELRASSTITASTPSAPHKAVNTLNHWPTKGGNLVCPIATIRLHNRGPIAAPTAAPAWIPKSDGSASGFSKSVCVMSPQTPNPPPTSNAVNKRGSRKSVTMTRVLSVVSPPKRAVTTSPIEIGTLPLHSPTKRSAGTRASKHSGKTDRRVLSMSRNDERMEERAAHNVRSLRRPGMCISAYGLPPQRNGVKRLSAQAAPGIVDAGLASFFPACSTCSHARKRSEGAKGVSS